MTETLLKYISVTSAIVGVISVLVSLYSNILYRKVIARKQRTAEKYSKVFKELQSIFSEIHSERRKNYPQTLNEILNFLQGVTDKYKMALDDITESNCRITVKVISYEQGEYVVRTLIRDSFSEPSYKHFDTSFKSRLTDDTAALSIFSGNKYFLENDLSKNTGYSTSIKEQFKGTQKEWMLPYSSVLVVPIPYLADTNRNSILGFLTIDSSKRVAFDKSVDISIASGLADGMTPFLIQIQKLLPAKYE